MIFFTTRVGKEVQDFLKIHIPILNTVTKATLTSRFTRAFIILLRSGMLITDCMDNLTRILDNRVYQNKFEYAISEVKRGKRITFWVKKH